MASTERPLQIIVVGAGLGGCTAAFCFARLGHHVKVFEQRPALSLKGSGIMIRPPASRLFRSWGLGPDFEKISDNSSSTILRDLRTGNIATRNVAIDTSDSPDWGTHREAVQKIVYERAVKAGADIQLGVTIEDVFDTAGHAIVVLKDGSTHQADFVLAADGIRSRIRSKILADVQQSIDPIISKITLYGVKTTIQKLQSDKDAKRLIETVNLNVWMGKSLQVVGRTSHPLGLFGGLFGIVADDTDQTGLWDEDGDIEHVRKAFADSDPALQAALRLAPGCDRWKLAELPRLPRWTSLNGRIALLGDSAHAMLPNAAHGFSQIVEDIGVLDFLLASKRSIGIPAILDIWQTIRIPRADRIKEFAAWNTRVFLGEEPVNPLATRRETQQSGNIKSLKTVKADRDAPFHTSAFLKWAQDYDAVGEAKKYVEGLKAKI